MSQKILRPSISLALLACVSLLGNLAFAQSPTYPKGVYTSFEQLMAKNPASAAELEVERRTDGDIKMNGGNDYKLSATDESITKKAIKNDYLAYSDGDSLYINGFRYKVQYWYAPVLSDGKFVVIKAGLSMDSKIQKEQLKNRAQLGYLLGPVGGGIQGAKLAMLRFIYVIDKENNQISTVSRDVLKGLLAENPTILSQYIAEGEPSDQDVFLKYLVLLNAAD